VDFGEFFCIVFWRVFRVSESFSGVICEVLEGSVQEVVLESFLGLFWKVFSVVFEFRRVLGEFIWKF
jgi:hypothetical protein